MFWGCGWVDREVRVVESSAAMWRKWTECCAWQSSLLFLFFSVVVGAARRVRFCHRFLIFAAVFFFTS